MKTTSEHVTAALDSIQALRIAAVNGDSAAVAGLLEIANRSAGHLAAMSHHPEGKASRSLIDEISSKADHWPVRVPAVEDGRGRVISDDLPATFGKRLPYRTRYRGTGKPRDFDYRSRTGFTASVIAELRKEGTYPQSNTAAEIEAACMSWIERDCGGQWDIFPWPEQITSEAKREAHRANPVRKVISKWIADGVKSLVSKVDGN